jgi:hypothetical protein
LSTTEERRFVFGCLPFPGFWSGPDRNSVCTGFASSKETGPKWESASLIWGQFYETIWADSWGINFQRIQCKFIKYIFMINFQRKKCKFIKYIFICFCLYSKYWVHYS